MTTEQPQLTGHAHRRDSISEILGIAGRSGSIGEIASAMQGSKRAGRSGSIGEIASAMQGSKRARAGSISGRLRAASDLADFGLIDVQTKGQLKDLIIAGDPALIYALEKYEKGDLSELDVIIKRSKMNRKQSIDLLEGLDFDFLNVHKLDEMNSNALLDIDGDFFFGTDEGVLLNSTDKNRSDSDLLDILASDSNDQAASSSSSSSNSSRPKMRGRGRGRGRGHTATTTASGDSGEAMIDLSMYADKAAQLSSPLSKKASVKIRAPSPSLLPPRPPTSVSSVSGGHMYSESNQVELNAMQSTGGSINLQGVPNVNACSTYPFIMHPTQMMANQAYGVPLNPNADGSLNQEGFIGAYSPESRRERIQKFLEKRSRRVWTKKVKYDVRKNFADSRLRVKGRFVKKEDEEVLRTAPTPYDSADTDPIAAESTDLVP